MKKEILEHNSKMVDICLKELEDYIKSKENNQNEKIVEKKKAIKGIRKYRLGYDYLFLPKRTFKYKGDLIGGTSIMVLFKIYDMNGNEILFETEGEELKEQTIKLKNGEECYLCELFYCSFDKELFKDNQTFDFSPTMNVIMSNCRIAMEIHSYTKDIEVKLGYPYVMKLNEQNPILLCLNVGIRDKYITLVFPIHTEMTKDKPICTLKFHYMFDKHEFYFISDEKAKDGGYRQHIWGNYRVEDKTNIDNNSHTLVYENIIKPYALSLQDLLL